MPKNNKVNARAPCNHQGECWDMNIKQATVTVTYFHI